MVHLRSASPCSTSGRVEAPAAQRPCWQPGRPSVAQRGRPAWAGSLPRGSPGQQVVALTWEEAVRMQQQEQEQVAEWWGDAAESEPKPRGAAPVAAAQGVARPLKINLDLLLVRCWSLCAGRCCLSAASSKLCCGTHFVTLTFMR